MTGTSLKSSAWPISMSTCRPYIRVITFVRNLSFKLGGRAMKGLIVGLSVVIALGIVSSAYAHHSAAGIDQTKSVTVEGTVKQFKWANPHSWIEIEAPNSKGVTEIWNLEMNPPSF